MLNFCKKIWNDPVWSKVISFVIIGAGVQYFFPWSQLLVQLANKFLTFSMQRSEIFNWFFMLMALCTALFLLALMVILWQSIKPQDSVSSWKENYLQDKFFNVLWRWSYGYDGKIERVFTFCPSCDFQIYAEDSGAFAAVPRILFHCECCNKDLYDFQGSYDDLKSKTIRLLQQKIRNDSWNQTTMEG